MAISQNTLFDLLRNSFLIPYRFNADGKQNPIIMTDDNGILLPEYKNTVHEKDYQHFYNISCIIVDEVNKMGEYDKYFNKDLHKDLNKNSHIKHVIAVTSGKGGVGKSLMTSLLAVMMNRIGYNVGILDADITGPSIPQAFGLTEKLYGNDKGIIPAETRTGIKIVSLNLMLDNPTDPVVWRGSLISNTVTQFWTDVYWGELDYLFVDMPPGTGDVPLTVFQSLPVDGIITVSSPQELVSMVVEKSVNMAQMMNIPILGLVENMSYYICPDCGNKHYLFGESHIDEIAKKFNISTVCRLPMDPAITKVVDAGLIETITQMELMPIVNELMKED